MIRLVGIELDRFRARLLIRLGVIALLVLSGLTLISAWDAAKPASAAQVAQATQYFEQQEADWKENGPQMLADCRAQEATARKDAEAAGTDPADVDYGCDHMAPTLANFLPKNPNFAVDTAGLLGQLAALYVLVPAVLAVSFVAAEFSTGAIGNWLTFAPRRTRVLASKLAAAVVATIPYAALGLGLVIGGSWLIYAHFGEAHGGTGEIWAESGRILALAAVVAMVGAALGTLLRHTAAALGVVLGWAVLVEGILMNVATGLRPWSVVMNITAWTNGGAEYYVNKCTTTPTGQECTAIVHQVSQTHGAVVGGVVAVALVAAALLVFRRRDIA
ncbi:ABC transporter permease subunit [Cellulomonas sp. URHD0024]|uniref:ABC transporter permease subunit n=1 Tax=Cellulomonas sp. URHD0024 TaxID=1302620 RepID=UPI00040C5B15|nr:ABC transporter permease subunit [Cellulomonas sp. URHD0024]